MLVGYMRVSKADGSQSTDLQRDALVAAGVDPDNLYDDQASGKKDDRPQLAACLKGLRNGDTLLVWKLDRLGRDLRHLVNTVHDLTDRGVGLKVLTGAGAVIDTTTASGKLVFGIFAALAEFERALISERTVAGLAAARARGRNGGRPYKMTAAKVRLGLEQLRDPNVRCSVVVDDAGLVHAVASWLPIYTTGKVTGWTLDFMRRRTDGFRHASELLIAQGALDFQAKGYAVLSLSGAPLARAEHAEAEPAPGIAAGTSMATAVAGARSDALDVMLEYLGTRLEPVYGFRSLLRFKAKFDPQYRPMYLLYADAASLPAIGRAVARAYIPDASLGMLLRIANTVFERSRVPARRPPTPSPTPPQPTAPTPRPPQSPNAPTPSDVRTPAIPDVASTYAPLPATSHR